MQPDGLPSGGYGDKPPIIAWSNCGFCPATIEGKQMSRKPGQLKIIGWTDQGNFPRYASAAIISALAVATSVFLPYHADNYLYFSLPLGIIALLSAVLWIRKPIPQARYLLQISASILLALIAYRCISYAFSGLSPITEMLMASILILVHTLELWNKPAAVLISDEIYAPKTWAGKIIFRTILFIAPVAGIAGSFLGKAGVAKNPVLLFLAGLLFAYLAYSIPFPALSSHSTRDARIPVNDNNSLKSTSGPKTPGSAHKLYKRGK
jgi:hypothetical protein